MKRSKRGSWWGLYALLPAMAGMLYLVATLRAGRLVHTILLVAVLVCVGTMALLWSEQHPDLMGAEGVNAQAEESTLADAGIQPGRLAPSQTARQAHYRQVMLVRKADEASQPGRRPP